MLFDLPDDDVLYGALIARDPAYDGFAFAGVTTTGVFCRLTCPARKPKREHTIFFASVAACMEAGFRPCKRCRPLSPAFEIEFFDRKALATELKNLQRITRSGIGFGRLPPIDRIERELSAYFDGRSTTFATPLARQGSAFAREVWDALRAIPSGETRSHAAIALAIGRLSAVRAVARANGANSFAIVIPCHRVIGSDGALTGYGGALWRKRWLIEHERRLAAQRSAEHKEGDDDGKRDQGETLQRIAYSRRSTHSVQHLGRGQRQSRR